MRKTNGGRDPNPGMWNIKRKAPLSRWSLILSLDGRPGAAASAIAINFWLKYDERSCWSQE